MPRLWLIVTQPQDPGVPGHLVFDVVAFREYRSNPYAQPQTQEDTLFIRTFSSRSDPASYASRFATLIRTKLKELLIAVSAFHPNRTDAKLDLGQGSPTTTVAAQCFFSVFC